MRNVWVVSVVSVSWGPASLNPLCHHYHSKPQSAKFTVTQRGLISVQQRQAFCTLSPWDEKTQHLAWRIQHKETSWVWSLKWCDCLSRHMHSVGIDKKNCVESCLRTTFPSAQAFTWCMMIQVCVLIWITCLSRPAYLCLCACVCVQWWSCGWHWIAGRGRSGSCCWMGPWSRPPRHCGTTRGKSPPPGCWARNKPLNTSTPVPRNIQAVNLHRNARMGWFRGGHYE